MPAAGFSNDDWEEIYYALARKADEIEDGRLDDEPGEVNRPDSERPAGPLTYARSWKGSRHSIPDAFCLNACRNPDYLLLESNNAEKATSLLPRAEGPKRLGAINRSKAGRH